MSEDSWLLSLIRDPLMQATFVLALIGLGFAWYLLTLMRKNWRKSVDWSSSEPLLADNIKVGYSRIGNLDFWEGTVDIKGEPHGVQVYRNWLKKGSAAEEPELRGRFLYLKVQVSGFISPIEYRMALVQVFSHVKLNFPEHFGEFKKSE